MTTSKNVKIVDIDAYLHVKNEYSRIDKKS